MNVEELLSKHRIDFKYSGNDAVVKCLNPEHEDNNPSLRIDRLTGKMHCYSCGFAGNIFNYFNEAQNLLVLKAISIKEKIKKLRIIKKYIPLSAKPFNRDYRNIKAETFKRFEAFTDDISEELSGLKDRIIFPIYNMSVDIVVFHARYENSNAKPKYKNYPENTSLPLFPNIPDEIIDGTIILVEGFFDMLNLYDKGLKNAVCIFTANIVSKKDRGHVNLLNRFAPFKMQGVSKIILMLDGDDAGRVGANALEKALSSSYIVQKLELEDGTDPGDLSQEDVDSIRDYLYEKSSNS